MGRWQKWRAIESGEVRKDSVKDSIESKMGGGAEHGHGAEGGAHGGDFRMKVWSMTGGSNCRPKHWRRNTALALAGVFLICIPIAMKSAELEQRPHPPIRPIPSQLWCKNFGTKDYNELE